MLIMSAIRDLAPSKTMAPSLAQSVIAAERVGTFADQPMDDSVIE